MYYRSDKRFRTVRVVLELTSQYCTGEDDRNGLQMMADFLGGGGLKRGEEK